MSILSRDKLKVLLGGKAMTEQGEPTVETETLPPDVTVSDPDGVEVDEADDEELEPNGPQAPT